MVQFVVIFEAAVCVFAWFLGWLLNVPLIGQMHISPISLAAGIFATAPLLLLMWWCSVSNWDPLRALMVEVEESLVPLFLGAPRGTLLLISLLAGLGEEWLFRGVIQMGLTGWFGLPVALLATSALFGLAHLITPTYAALAGLIGIYLGILAIITDSLFAPVVAHALYDWVALSYLVSPKRRKVT